MGNHISRLTGFAVVTGYRFLRVPRISTRVRLVINGSVFRILYVNISFFQLYFFFRFYAVFTTKVASSGR